MLGRVGEAQGRLVPLSAQAIDLIEKLPRALIAAHSPAAGSTP